jgi:Mlc titration factor MtfA (ptsG expression regulator)
MISYFRRRRRRALMARPFPTAWRAYVDKNVSAFARLDAARQAALLGHAQVLLVEKNWEGCGGLALTDEIRVTIAAQAARLLLGRPGDYFPTVRSILVYPSTVVERRESHRGGGIWEEDDQHSAGLATGRLGAIVIAWDAARHGARRPSDGHDVVLHEFAHELDYQDGHFDGAPPLASAAEYRAWSEALRPEFEKLQAAVEAGEQTVLDAYGATDPAEFFAVLTETFFEKPRELLERHPALYERLRQFYVQDPVRDA